MNSSRGKRVPFGCDVWFLSESRSRTMDEYTVKVNCKPINQMQDMNGLLKYISFLYLNHKLFVDKVLLLKHTQFELWDWI